MIEGIKNDTIQKCDSLQNLKVFKTSIVTNKLEYIDLFLLEEFPSATIINFVKNKDTKEKFTDEIQIK